MFELDTGLGQIRDTTSIRRSTYGIVSHHHSRVSTILVVTEPRDIHEFSKHRNLE